MSQTSEPDCASCNHSRYDHIDFRSHLKGEAAARTSCRIAHCRCPVYTQEAEAKPVYLGRSGSDPFNPTKIYCHAVPHIGPHSSLVVATKNFLHHDAKLILPSGQYYELRLSIPSVTGQEIYWIYEPWMNSPGPFNLRWAPDLNPIQQVSHGLYYIVGGYYA